VATEVEFNLLFSFGCLTAACFLFFAIVADQ
jgi:hypothetical protein